MEVITATFKIVTPMFIGGADQSPSDGIRPPSVKGALRFWWRALNWGRFRSVHTDDVSALKALHEEEVKLFGGSANTENHVQKGGQGCFLLTVQQPVKWTSREPHLVHPELKTKPAACYLGYGLIRGYGQLERGCINENQTFTVTLTFRDKVDNTVLNALKAFGLLGSLGSRSRHGMGSVALVSLMSGTKEIWSLPRNERSYDAEIRGLFSSLSFPKTEPPFSAFWQNSRIDRLLSANNPYEVLDQFGKKMMDYRSWGQRARGNILPSGSPSEERFKDDHDWFKGLIRNPNFHPERVEFGLPHNYHKGHHHVIPEKHDRRASPLLFHVHLIGKVFWGVSIYLPAQFLPSGEGVVANKVTVPNAVRPRFIPDFLDGRVGDTPTTPKPMAPFRFPFPFKVPVLP